MQQLSDTRQFGGDDECAIFIEDTMDPTLAKCVTNSPSAVALLSPQRLVEGAYVDVTEYDGEHLHGGYVSGVSSSVKKKRLPMHRGFCDLTNQGVRLNFKGGAPEVHETPGKRYVAQTELERVEKERNRYQKMYEHQKALYEEMSEKQRETYQRLQDKIVEVVALSTRNEESKRFIRQLKKEMLESRSRVLDMRNHLLEESRNDKSCAAKYEAMLSVREQQFTATLQEVQAKAAGFESLLSDIVHVKGENASLHSAQLDALLKASYAKNAALFGDYVKQGKRLELLFDRKMELERQIDALRKERKELEMSSSAERRRMAVEQSRIMEQVREQQAMILDLRQMLVRTMASDSPCTPDDESHQFASPIADLEVTALLFSEDEHCPFEATPRPRAVPQLLTTTPRQQ
jgi:hypothetical protein